MLAAQAISDAALAETIVDRVLSRLSHINPAIIMSAAKVILKYSLVLKNDKIIDAVCRKISSPLTSILNSSNEVAWTFMRNAEILVEKFPGLFQNVRVFFINYNDPCYIKFEKVKLMFRLCDQNNVKIIINEFAEYSYDTNAELSRMAFQYLWKIGLKFESASEAVVTAMYTILLNSSDSGFNDHLLNEAVVGCDFIYRRYQVPTILSNIVMLIAGSYSRINENDSQRSLLSILPQFAEVLKSAQEIIGSFVDSFVEMATEVRLALLTATVRMFIAEPIKYKEPVYRLLQMAAEQVEVPDVRDRAFIYWRLLDMSPVLASRILQARKDKIQDQEITEMPTDLVEALFEKLGSISSTQHDNKRFATQQDSTNAAEDSEEIIANRQKNTKTQKEDDLLGIDLVEDDVIIEFKPPVVSKPVHPIVVNKPTSQITNDNLFDMNFVSPISSVTVQPVIQQSPITTTSPSFGNLDLDLLAFGKQPVINTPAESKKADDIKNKYADLDAVALTINSQQSLAKTKSPEQPKPQNEDLFSFDIKIPKPDSTPREVYKYEFRNKKPEQLLSANSVGHTGKTGVRVTGGFLREGQFLKLDVNIQNFNDTPITYLNFEMTPNVFGLLLTEGEYETEIAKDQTQHLQIALTFDPNSKTEDWRIDGNGTFRVTLSTNIDTFDLSIRNHLNNIFVF